MYQTLSYYLIKYMGIMSVCYKLQKKKKSRYKRTKRQQVTYLYGVHLYKTILG